MLGVRYLYFKRNAEKFGVRAIGRKMRYFVWYMPVEKTKKQRSPWELNIKMSAVPWRRQLVAGFHYGGQE
jgi:hypothetical protein